MEIYPVAKDLQHRRFHKPASHPLCCLTTPVRTSFFISSFNLIHGTSSQFLLVSCINPSHTWRSFLRLLPSFSSLGWSIPIPSTSSYKPNFLTCNHLCDFPLNFGIPMISGRCGESFILPYGPFYTFKKGHHSAFVYIGCIYRYLPY